MILSLGRVYLRLAQDSLTCMIVKRHGKIKFLVSAERLPSKPYRGDALKESYIHSLVIQN